MALKPAVVDLVSSNIGGSGGRTGGQAGKGAQSDVSLIDKSMMEHVGISFSKDETSQSRAGSRDRQVAQRGRTGCYATGPGLFFFVVEN